ncbi:Hpt domain-containing protein, partial [Desulfobacterales bacterium HSG2]|nr:Hpt domain-containing protein [Desulfobacterales bacterium HSG2]
EFREKCKVAGMDDFVTKPVDSPELGAVIEKHVSGTAVVSETPESETSEDWHSVPDKPESEKTEGRHPVLDKKEILLRVGGNEAVFETLCNLFVRDIPKMTEKLRQAISRNNMEEIRLQAHALKGMCGNMSAKSCQNLAKQLEDAAKDEKSEQTAV